MGKERLGRETHPLRLHVVVEGQTEEGFANEILAPELGTHGIFIDAHRITTGRKHGRLHRGGWDSYTKLRRDLVLWMKQDRGEDSWFSTMVDLYGLPDDFPGYQACAAIADPRKRVESLEEYLTRDVKERLADDPVAERFVPYIQLHEFEALLFSDASKFLAAFPEGIAAVDRLQAICTECGGPENINDGDDTAPSKRILEVLPEYIKPVSSLLILRQIGLPTVRRECPHFDGWITRLAIRADAL